VHVPPESAFVLGDHKRLVQVMANLLNNAAKFTPAGGSIVLSLAVDDEHVTLSVADNGIGMTPELVEHAFELFAQAERTSDRSEGGLGLGLAIVKSLVDLHQGRVTATCTGLGFGSEFTVQLPRITALGEPPTQDNPTVTFDKGLRLMVIDDNVDGAHMLAMLLEASGYQVFEEHESKRSLERALIELPDVCLLDIGLPGMDGYELARCLRSQPEMARAILIATTGYGDEKSRKDSVAAGFDHHFTKPIDTARLFKLLAEISAANCPSMTLSH
jgi:CheY-like chemotaxis protein